VRRTRCLLAEYAASLRFQTSAPLTQQGRARTSLTDPRPRSRSMDIPNIKHRVDQRPRRSKTASIKEQWWSLSGSNRRPEACKATALPAELRPLCCSASVAGESIRFLGFPRHQARRPVGLASALAGFGSKRHTIMVGLGRLERPTSPLSGVRSNHLSYRPSQPGPIPKDDPRPTDVWNGEEKRRRQRPAYWDLTDPLCSKEIR
jgi:hypothetical protein